MTTIRDRRAQLRDEDGQALILVAIMLGTAVLMAALVTNIGVWFATDSGLQKAADNTAVVTMQYMALKDSGRDPKAVIGMCNLVTIVTPADCGKKVAVANDVLAVNTSLAIVPFGGGQAVQATVTQPKTGGFFAAALNLKSDRKAVAYAAISGPSGVRAGLPITFPDTNISSWTDGQTHTFTFDQNPSPGSFGMLGLCAGGGASDLAACISCAQTYNWPGLAPNPIPAGCAPVDVCINDPFDTITGGKYHAKKVEDAMQALADAQAVVLIPVFHWPDGQTGTGTKATYTMSGFVAFQMTGFSKGSGTVTGIFRQLIDPAQLAAKFGCTGTSTFFGSGTVKIVG